MKKGLLILMAVVGLAGCQNGTSAEEIEPEGIDNEEEVNSALRDNEVVRIEDDLFLEDDLEFYGLMQEVKIELQRHQDQQQFDGNKLAEREDYWDDQLDYVTNYNVQLHHLIELHAMAKLAEEKHYVIPPEKLEAQLDELEAHIAEATSAGQLIESFGNENFKQAIRPYLEASLLRDRVSEDLLKELREEKPDAEEQELNYLLGGRFEELYRDQIDSLQVEIQSTN